ncbi:MAG: hypothetical protein KKD17_02860 [Nanoarchaeota archaeon]|nr:hypothetical protein [Nanoarchaeota archaeon]
MHDENQVQYLDCILGAEDPRPRREPDPVVDLDSMRDPFFVSERYENVRIYCAAMLRGAVPDTSEKY